jgi:N-methylhydantoinase A
MAAPTPESSRPAFFGIPHGVLETTVTQRANIDTSRRDGPLIVEEYDATTLVPPGWSIRRDARENLLIERSQPA